MERIYFLIKLWLSLPVLTFFGGVLFGIVTQNSVTITCDECCRVRKATECRKQLMKEIRIAASM